MSVVFLCSIVSIVVGGGASDPTPLPEPGIVTSEPIRIRVLSYNIHHGAGADGRIDLDRTARVIGSVTPDVVALQEVDRGVARTERIDEPALLADSTGLRVVFEPNIRYQGGDYGNAVLSRLPIVSQTNRALPSMYDGEQRGVLDLEVRAGGPDGPILRIFATHLDYRSDDAERLASADMINRLPLEDPDQPAILLGDLNALPDSPTLQQFQTHWKRVNAEPLSTSPVDRPTRQIDYILVRPADRWRVVEVRVLDEPIASDHRPIFAVLELQPE